MNTTRYKYSVVLLKYGLLLGLAVAFFSSVKTGMYVNLESWDTYAAFVAVAFLATGVWLGRRTSKAEKTPATPPPLPEELLSKREMEVLEFLLMDKSNKQIADELCIEMSTLKTHINKIYKKLGVKNRKQLGLLDIHSIA
ncbi:MAG TPA: LuxR C-terminal-related transcriptional regulator [Bacteroidia bacterium]|nr:LuxR C-terminal-related transcriptional regulator [Bacteroidia bacterium]